MKIGHLIAAAVILMLVGCSFITFERMVENNTFISTADPKVRIRINPDFKYLGHVGGSPRRQNIRGVHGLLVSNNSYLFADVSKEGVILKGVVVRVDRLSKTGWGSDLFSDVRNKIVNDFQDMSDNRWQHFLAVRSDIFTEDEMKFVMAEGMKEMRPETQEKKVNLSGYTIPQCFMVEGFGVRAGAGNEIRLCVYYFEDLTAIDEVSTCRDWSKGEVSATDEEKVKTLFTEDREKTLTFLKQRI